MRIPIPAVLLLSILVIAITWWAGSRNKDFLTPPSAIELARARNAVEFALPTAGHPADAISAPLETREVTTPVPDPEPQPPLDLGDLAKTPTLPEYSDAAATGASHLADLAALLETEGEFQRALLAWERVLDSTKAGQDELNAAISSIARLRPTLADWNTDPKATIPLVLHAGTGRKTAKTLGPILEETARELERASAGILKISTKTAVGKSSTTAAPAPVALWIAGPMKEAPSTDVLSFTSTSPDTLPALLQQTIFQLVRDYLEKHSSLTAPPPLDPNGSPTAALHTRITRLHWHELGIRLNQKPTPAH